MLHPNIQSKRPSSKGCYVDLCNQTNIMNQQGALGMPGMGPAGHRLEVGTPAWGSIKGIFQVTARLDLFPFKRNLTAARMLEKGCISILKKY